MLAIQWITNKSKLVDHIKPIFFSNSISRDFSPNLESKTDFSVRNVMKKDELLIKTDS